MFHFKQFSIKQEQSAAKVGTDGVLLGAWANIFGNVLDIGAGIGLVSLMLAQRFFNTKITALEIEEQAFKECQLNFENSKWKERLEVQHIDFEKFNPNQKFDSIVSNPPFYTETVNAKTKERTNARSTQSLSFELLVKKSSELISEQGNLIIIIPYKEEEQLIQLASENQLFPKRILKIKGREDLPFKRSLIEFTKQNTNTEIQTLTIEIERNIYTEEYMNLTKAFYLKF